MRTLGVIGGVGPLSTAYFMETLINLTDATIDQEHINMIVLNHAEIPDRTSYILDNTKPNPVNMMTEDAKKLEHWGADILVILCNTAHYFFDELQKSVTIPFVNMIEETAIYLEGHGIKRAGILATNGTIFTNIFQNALARHGIVGVCPGVENQQFVMDIIYDNIKAAKPVDLDKFKSVVNELRLGECDRIILGCTELSILKREYSLNEFYVDSLELLAKATIIQCGKKVK